MTKRKAKKNRKKWERLMRAIGTPGEPQLHYDDETGLTYRLTSICFAQADDLAQPEAESYTNRL